jgi:hypothetical protein
LITGHLSLLTGQGHIIGNIFTVPRSMQQQRPMPKAASGIHTDACTLKTQETGNIQPFISISHKNPVVFQEVLLPL